MKSLLWIQAMLTALPLSSCGTTYYLPGHNESNSHSPPAITMTQGESKLILTEGLNLPLLSLPSIYWMKSSNPEVADIEGGKWIVRLIAKRPGRTRVYYNAFSTLPENRGFEVTVLPAKH